MFPLVSRCVGAGTMAIEDEIARLETKAAQVRKLLPFGRRAFTVEFAGTPKSGKTTSVSVLSNFLKRNGFRVYIIQERASFCPIPMKGHLFFNTWTSSTMLAGILEHIETEVDVLIADRGIFDSLVWLELQQVRGEVLENEAVTISQFLLLPRWAKLIDSVLALMASPETAMARERAPLLTTRLGSVMNAPYLTAFNAAYTRAIEKYRNSFSAFHIIDTTSSTDSRDTNAGIAHIVLDELAAQLDRPVLVIPRGIAAQFRYDSGIGCFDPPYFNSALTAIKDNGRLVARSEAEMRDDLVQVIPAGVLMHNGRPFIFERHERDPKFKLYGRMALWKGCHAHTMPQHLSSDALGNEMLDRIADEMFLSRRFPYQPIGYAWDQGDEKSSKHLGVAFAVTIDSDDAANGIHSKEFRKVRGSFVVPKLNVGGGHVEPKDEGSWLRTAVRETEEELSPLRHKQDFELRELTPDVLVSAEWSKSKERFTNYCFRYFAFSFLRHPSDVLRLVEGDPLITWIRKMDLSNDASRRRLSVPFRLLFTHVSGNLDLIPLSWPEELTPSDKYTPVARRLERLRLSRYWV